MIRTELQNFAEAMEQKMRKHDGDWADSWKTCEVNLLQTKLFDEIQEYCKDNSKEDELVDIANMCMMIWNRTKPVTDEKVCCGTKMRYSPAVVNKEVMTIEGLKEWNLPASWYCRKCGKHINDETKEEWRKRCKHDK